jgi:hypothetical protein
MHCLSTGQQSGEGAKMNLCSAMPMYADENKVRRKTRYLTENRLNRDWAQRIENKQA